MSARPRLGLVGAGRLARVLLPALVDAGWPTAAICSRRIESARAARRGLSGVRAVRGAAQVALLSELLLLAVPDGRIEPLAVELAEADVDWAGRTVLHASGILGPDVLAALARRGAACGVWHPFQCLADPALASRVLPGSRVRIEGDPRAARTARRLARDLGLVPLRRPHGAVDREAYHAAASLGSNDVVALLSEAVETMQAAGYRRREAVAAIAALARGTLAHIEAGGIEHALTGPVVRGDDATLRKQLRRLRVDSPARATLHRLLSRRLLALAEAAGVRLERGARARLRRLLGTGGSRSGRGV